MSDFDRFIAALNAEQPPEPADPVQVFPFDSDAPADSLYRVVSARINGGVYALLTSIVDFMDAQPDFSIMTHLPEVARRAAAAAELVQAVLTLQSAPGVKAYLKARPGGDAGPQPN